MKAHIIKILNEEKNICSHGADYVINIEDFEIVAERIVKLFAIPVESKSLPTDEEIEKKLKPILKEIYNSGFDDSSIFSSCFNKWVSQITALTYKPTEYDYVPSQTCPKCEGKESVGEMYFDTCRVFITRIYS